MTAELYQKEAGVALCPVCGYGGDFKSLLSAGSIHTQDYFSVGECPQCLVQKVLDIPKDLGKYYKNTLMKRRSNPLHRFLKEILLKRELRRILKWSGPDHTYMDLGCGTGDFAKLMHAQGLDVMAVDAASERPVDIESAREIPYYRINYADFEISGLRLQKKGTVILRHVLEHIADPGRFLRKLVSSGVTDFYIVVPNHDCLASKVFGQYYAFLDPPVHLWFYKMNSLKQLLGANGLDVVGAGFGTIPNVLLCLYRFLILKGCPRKVCDALGPHSVLCSLSAPLDVIFPNNIIWAYAKVKG